MILCSNILTSPSIVNHTDVPQHHTEQRPPAIVAQASDLRSLPRQLAAAAREGALLGGACPPPTIAALAELIKSLLLVGVERGTLGEWHVCWGKLWPHRLGDAALKALVRGALMAVSAIPIPPPYVMRAMYA